MREEASGLQATTTEAPAEVVWCIYGCVTSLRCSQAEIEQGDGSRQFSPAVNILKGFLQQCLSALLSVPVVMFLTSTSCSQLADNGCQLTSNCKLLATSSVYVSSISFCLSIFSLIRSRQADL